MRILFVGDVYGEPGQRIVRERLRGLRERLRCDWVIVNGENAAAGLGITPRNARDLFQWGADALTSGNHIWRKSAISRYLEEEPRLLRPANFPAENPGRGLVVLGEGAAAIAVINVMGRVFMDPLDCPFQVAETLLAGLDPAIRVRLIDFHAEATSEKQAFARHFDGRVSAVVGTHTHVATADERVLPLGTGTITDVGMTGPIESVIGMDCERAVARFVNRRTAPIVPAGGRAMLNGVLLDVDDESGRCLSIERIREDEDVSAS
ncbi:MAG: TIGR00282 family metallophosphoesterase [Myxococcales bacterium]|nr:TIGR00282 family metallophosphoesterase [Myxococcales bacterium]